MEIISVYPKELHTKLEFSESDLNYLLDFLNNCEAKLNLKDEYQGKCNAFVTKELFPKLQTLSEEMKRMR